MSRNSEAHSAYDNSSSSDTPTQQLSPAHYILLQKQQEHAGLEALREASAGMLERVEKLAAMSNIMANGGEAIGNVMRNWPHVFSILNLFDKPPSPPRSPNGTVLADEEPDEPIPELVRLPYNSQQEEE